VLERSGGATAALYTFDKWFARQLLDTNRKCVYARLGFESAKEV
jgi:hypothetical protein